MILRPAIIICSYQEPYPGWTDSMAAAGSLTLMVASGITKFLMGNDYNRADLIPVDQVANSIICGTAF
jgi:alcohol-forming fatty acyl-CoA reductase